MAATRVLAAALHSNINLKQPFSFRQKALSVTTARPRRRFFFTCTALHKPSNVQIKEEGQPQTLDYRVFFMDDSGKRVSPFLSYSRLFWVFGFIAYLVILACVCRFCTDSWASLDVSCGFLIWGVFVFCFYFLYI